MASRARLRWTRRRWRRSSRPISAHRPNARNRLRFRRPRRNFSALAAAREASRASRTSSAHLAKAPASVREASFRRHRCTSARWRLNSSQVDAHPPNAACRVRLASAASDLRTLARCSFRCATRSPQPRKAAPTLYVAMCRRALVATARSPRWMSTSSSHRSNAPATWRFAILARHRFTTARCRFSSWVIASQLPNARASVRYIMYRRACSARWRACSASLMSRTRVAHCSKPAASTRCFIFCRHRWTTARWRLNSCHWSRHSWKNMKSSRFRRPRRNFSAFMIALLFALRCSTYQIQVPRAFSMQLFAILSKL